MKKEIITLVLLLALVKASIYSRTAITAINPNNRIERVETGIDQLKGSEGENNHKNSRSSLPSLENEQIIEEDNQQESVENDHHEITAPHKIKEAVSFYGSGNEFVS